jgi:CSLREA domain-containing protein
MIRFWNRDDDAGSNLLQNYPTLESASIATGSLLITYAVDTVPGNAAYPLRIEFFVADSASSGQGKTLIGSDTYLSGEAGTTVTADLGAAGPLGVSVLDPIVATSIDHDGNTSEFSDPVQLLGEAVELTVNTTDDDDDGLCDATHCSLREALSTASSNGGFTDTVRFSIPGAGPHTIQPGSQLPNLDDQVVIDGTSEPDYAGAPIIELDGSQGDARDGLVLSAGSSTVKGLVINRFEGHGLRILGGDSYLIQGCYIGTSTSGNVARGNGADGINFGGRSSDNTVGGAGAGEGNLISGNGGIGISIGDTGNGEYSIQGNLIGTDIGGTGDLGNGGHGIRIPAKADSLIGGSAAGEGNLISGNGGNGVLVSGLPFRPGPATVITGNRIGTEIDGTAALGNDGNGVKVATGEDTVIGGAAGEGNVIAHNGGNGVEVATAVRSCRISSNAIFSNSGLAVDLGGNGVSANDELDVDDGANDLQNFPVLGSATGDGSSLAIYGTLHSHADSQFTIEFFASEQCDSSGHGEAETPLGTTSVRTDGEGNGTFSGRFPVPAGAHVTATAEREGDTSELSACVLVGYVFADSFETGDTSAWSQAVP